MNFDRTTLFKRFSFIRLKQEKLPWGNVQLEHRRNETKINQNKGRQLRCD